MDGTGTNATRLLQRHLINIEQPTDNMPDPWTTEAPAQDLSGAGDDNNRGWHGWHRWEWARGDSWSWNDATDGQQASNRSWGTPKKKSDPPA